MKPPLKTPNKHWCWGGYGDDSICGIPRESFDSATPVFRAYSIFEVSCPFCAGLLVKNLAESGRPELSRMFARELERRGVLT